MASEIPEQLLTWFPASDVIKSSPCFFIVRSHFLLNPALCIIPPPILYLIPVFAINVYIALQFSLSHIQPPNEWLCSLTVLHPITLMWYSWQISASSKPCHTSLITPMHSSTLEPIKPWSIIVITSLWLLRFPEPSSTFELTCHQVPTLISLSIV